MTFKLTIKKIGNHWYPDITHDYPEDIKLDEKIDRFLDIVDKNNSKELDLFFYEQGCVIEDDVLQFDESDMLRYYTTSDEFDITVYFNCHKFKISSSLYNLLEIQFNFDAITNFYKISLY